ncbi:beta subunit of protein farnesyltransferase [Chloropicon primus]|uniref:Protein farnesyltransferase subunit beta n=1 Tax=Chloropicon primus TaxID=1764295 RepID=A0A5B8MF49_9CHLO|nr:hypothetical protein A3770_01p04900 [Chloropicon primus]UPQ97187.1 beta subunit of protein farnesyltransferase [Chloropicon primus]|eukprot:QDZ17972.1 hypothetical protein A3770_01p04900 [Chloropicon primus]
MATTSERETLALRRKVVGLLERGKRRRREEEEEEGSVSVSVSVEGTKKASTSRCFVASCFSRERVEAHVRFMLSGLKQLSPGFASLDASRPWLLYWVVHGLSLLGFEYERGDTGGEKLVPAAWYPYHEEVSEQLRSALERAPNKRACLDFLGSCQNPSGGYGGGPQQLSHIATTYAAVAALVIVGGKGALEQVDKAATKEFFRKMQVRQGDQKGAFTVHNGGEVDMRACYLAMAVCRMLGLDTDFLDVEGMVEYIRRCQSYEGGFGGEPGNEAHGGYSYCAFAALSLVGKEDEVDLYQLLEWVSNRQQPIEGGFNGRTNKLVDSCYSFWQGSLVCLVSDCYNQKFGADSCEAFHSEALQDWVLLCCQLDDGGLRDKPGTNPDYYHTCYSLSGLSLCFRIGAPDEGKTDLLCNIRADKLSEVMTKAVQSFV